MGLNASSSHAVIFQTLWKITLASTPASGLAIVPISLIIVFSTT